mgnify:CR=1 FL=1
MKIQYFFIVCLLISSFSTQKMAAQDAEFSQFYAAPSYLNPAMIGFSVEPRIVVNYRHQYASFDNAYLTFAAAYDQHFDKYNSSFGMSILADRSGQGLYNTYALNALYAYQLQLSQELSLKVGLQAGYFQQGIAWDKVVFGDMIDPQTGAISTSSTENLNQQNTIRRLDFGGGLVAYTPTFYMGASFKHITRQNVSFTDLNDLENRLAIRSVFHVGKVFYFGKPKDPRSGPSMYASPNFLFINQGRFLQLNGGIYLGKGALFSGFWFRHTVGNSDALIFLLGVKAGVTRIAYSYDFNLTPIGTNAGSHELSLIVDWGQTDYAKNKAKRKQSGQCPEIF